MKKTLYKIHKWVGLSLGVLLLLQAVTGLMMAHKNGLRSLFEKGAGIDASLPHVPLDHIVGAITTALPEYRLERLVYAEDPSLPLIARVFPNGGGKFHVVTVDPTDGEIISSGSLWESPLQLAERIHVSLLSGDLGHNILLLEAIALVFMAVSGLVVWWPRKGKFAKALIVHWRAPSIILLRDLHLVPGALTAILMFLAGLTGALIIADPLVKPVVAAVAPVNPEIRLQLADLEQPETELSWQEALDRLKERLPDGRLRQLRFWGGEGRVLAAVMVAEDAFNPRAHHIAAVDRWTDDVMVFADGNALPAGDAFLEWLLPLHTGEAFGPLRPVLMTILGFSLAGMSITGLWLWIKKRPRSRKKVVPMAMANVPRSKAD
tara:strand:+ start:511 stop:1641 length:1131 start_codon:yes stop_codon:yes gene_type:complete